MAAYPTETVRTKNWSTETLTDADLEAQLDILHTWINAAMNSSTGHKHDGTTSEGPKIILTAAAGVTGTLPLANGGTGQTTLAGLLGLVYPVGCIYTNITGTNPNTELGFGTWVAFGAGKVIVGYNAADEDFDTAEETGGSKTVDASHTHDSNTTGAGEFLAGAGYGDGGESTHQHTFDTETGGSATLDIVQPYIVAHMWKRTV